MVGMIVIKNENLKLIVAGVFTLGFNGPHGIVTNGNTSVKNVTVLWTRVE